MHGLRWRGLETERYATAPVHDPTKGLVSGRIAFAVTVTVTPSKAECLAALAAAKDALCINPIVPARTL